MTELVANGGNASAAARAVGYHPDHGRRLVSRDATVRATLERMHRQTEAELREWIELAPQAQRVLVDLLDSTDDRVRFHAAVHIIERALGKVPQQIEQRIEHRASLSWVEMQCVLSLVGSLGLGWLEAKRYVEEHPEEVRDWAVRQVHDRTDTSASVP